MAISVTVNGDSPEALDFALKKLKNKIKKSNIMIDLKKSEYFIKPSAKKRMKRLKAIMKQKKNIEIYA